MLDLTIIVVNWNTRDLLDRCLEAAYQTVHGLKFEVLVIDNASTDGSVLMVQRRFPEVRLIVNEENKGFSQANNQGINAGQGRYVLLLNSDAFLTGDAVLRMSKLLDEEDSAGIVGPGLVFSDGSFQASYGALPTLGSEMISLMGLDKLVSTSRAKFMQQDPVETGRVSGACLLARRSMLDQVGLLDESFFFFSEEVDLCYRAKKAGWKVFYLPSAQVVHIGGGSTGLIPFRLLLLYQGKLHYFSKHLGRSSAGFYRVVLWLVTVIKWAIYSLFNLLRMNKNAKGDLWKGVLQGFGDLHL